MSRPAVDQAATGRLWLQPARTRLGSSHRYVACPFKPGGGARDIVSLAGERPRATYSRRFEWHGA